MVETVGIETDQVMYVIRLFASYCALMQAAPNGQRTKAPQFEFQLCKFMHGGGRGMKSALPRLMGGFSRA